MTQESTVALEMDDASVLTYLQSDPSFFARNPTFLSELKLPNPHGEGVISLSTKQIGLLRSQLEEKSQLLQELIAFGKANDAIHAQVHQLSLALLRANSMSKLHATLDSEVKQAFGLSYANLVLPDTVLPETFSSWLQTLEKPYCGAANAAINALIEPNFLAASDGSYSVIPMDANGNDATKVFILLAAKDAQHFTESMETDFLTKIGELFSARYASLD